MKTSSTVRVGKAQKLNMMGAGMAIRIAKEKNDPMFKKYEKLKHAYMKLKVILIKKYGMAGRRAALAAVKKSSSL